MEWLRRQMAGRYGSDQLSVALLVLTFLLILLGFIPKLGFLQFISYIPLLLCVFRMFSRRQDKRHMENYKFMVYWQRVVGLYYKKRQQVKNRRIYKYFRCPDCKQKMRVPRRKGKIAVICPKCHKQIIKKS